MNYDPTSPVILVIIIGILLFAALFTLLEYSVVKVRPTELAELKQNRKTKRAMYMVHHLSEYLSTAQVGVTVTSLILGWLGETYATDMLMKINLLPKNIAGDVSGILGILIFTFLHAVFTDLVPKNMAIDQPVRILMTIVTPVHFFHIIFYPLVWLFNITAAGVTKLLGFNPHPNEDIYSQNEIITLSQQSEKAGELDKDDVVFMKRSFEMNDKVASDVMIDRTQLTVINSKATVADAAKLYFNKKFSRYPVVRNNDKDHILGYVFSYDIMSQNRNNPKEKVTEIMRQIPMAYENDSLNTIMQIMVKNRAPIVVIQDEYGGTSGIITDKDIYEELFGNIREEIDHDGDEMIQKLKKDAKGNQSYKVSGKVNLDDFQRYFKENIDQFEDSEATTLTGFFLEEKYELKVGRPMRVDGFSFTPLDYNNAYVNNFRVVQIHDNKKNDKKDEASAKSEKDAQKDQK